MLYSKSKRYCKVLDELVESTQRVAFVLDEVECFEPAVVVRILCHVAVASDGCRCYRPKQAGAYRLKTLNDFALVCSSWVV